MNNRKIATRAEQQNMGIKIQDLNNNFTKRLGDLRTEAEAQKWQTTRLLISLSPMIQALTCDSYSRYIGGIRLGYYALSEKPET
jgi:hypothetical protein